MAKLRLTEPFIKALPLPTAHHALYHDEQVRGLAIRITRTGAKSFLFVYSRDGRERRLSLGPWSPPVSNRLGAPATRKAGGTLDWARQEAARLRLKVLAGEDPMQQRQDARAARETARQEDAREITIEALAGRYIAEWAKPRKRTWKEDERRLNTIVIPAWGKRKVKAITRADVRALLAPVEAGEAARPAEAGARLSLVRKLFSFAMDVGIIDVHPCLRLRLACGKPAPRQRALTTAQDLRVFWRITEPGSAWTRALSIKSSAVRQRRFTGTEADALRLLLFTGARASEVTDMQWNEVDLDAATWVLPAARSKNKRAHLVPLGAAALGLLRKRREFTDGEWVFPSTRRDHLTDLNLSRPLKEICRRIKAWGVPVVAFTPHDLRRTVETGMAASRVPKEYRDRVLNHVDGSVGGMHYNVYDYEEEKREALEKWMRRLEGLLTESVATVVPIRAGAR